MTTPAAELRAAVAKLRRVCTAAAPGPWTIANVPPYTAPVLLSRYDETPDDEDVLIVGSVDVEPNDQAVIQTLHPGVGLALAHLLDLAETRVLVYAPQRRPYLDAALTVARAINNGGQP